MGKARDLGFLAVRKRLLLHIQICNCRTGLVLWTHDLVTAAICKTLNALFASLSTNKDS